MQKILIGDELFKVSDKDAKNLVSWLKVRNKMDALNGRAGVRSVWNSIDKPIRGLVYQLNRIGLKTRFSCCGFTYNDEEEPKSHCKVPYVQFYVNVEDPDQVYNFRYLERSLKHWNNDHNGEGFYYRLSMMRTKETSGIKDTILMSMSIVVDPEVQNMYYSNDGFAIHDYEPIVILIDWAENAIKKVSIGYSDKFSIEDGNKLCMEQVAGWGVLPKKDKTFTI